MVMSMRKIEMKRVRIRKQYTCESSKLPCCVCCVCVRVDDTCLCLRGSYGNCDCVTTKFAAISQTCPGLNINNMKSKSKTNLLYPALRRVSQVNPYPF